MATQLIRKGPIAQIQEHMPLFLSARAMLGGFAFFVALGFFGLLAGLHNAQRDRDHAQQRFADAQALAAVPPASTQSIEEDLAVVKQQIATAEAGATPLATAPSGDANTTLLVRSAQNAGLVVKALSGVPAAQAKTGDALYDTRGLRITVEGALGQVTVFLDAAARAQPSLVPTLTTMTLTEAGVAHAELVFTTYTKVVPTPAPPAATPRGGRR